MVLCYDDASKRYDYCSSHLSAYIAIGVLVPLGIVFIVALVYIYLKCRRRQLRRQGQQTYMATIIPIYNTEQGHAAPYTYSYPPHYTPGSEEIFDKPPSYEQTIQETSETNNNDNNRANDSPAVLPVTPTTRNRP